MNKYKILMTLIIIFVLSACGGNINIPDQVQTPEEIQTQEEVQTLEDIEIDVVIPDEYMIESENYFDYQSGMECAAFASAYLLRHYGEEADGKTLFEDFPSVAPDGGTMPQGIVTLFQDRGYEAQYMTDGTVEDLKVELLKGAPVNVCRHVEEPTSTLNNTHYIPLVGYDEEYFYFAESLENRANCKNDTSLPYNRKTEITKFERLWENIDGFWNYPYFVISTGS